MNFGFSVCDITLHSVCSLDSFFRVGRVCLATGPGFTSSGRVLWSGVSWLGESQLRLPDAGAEKASHSRFAADTNILEPWGGVSPRL